MAFKNKYQRQKQQYSTDGGSTWIDVSPANYRRGRLLEVASDDCNNVEWIEVYGSWFCVQDTEIKRWVQTEETLCVNYDTFYVEKEQISRDGGETWEDTGVTRTEQIAEYDSYECTEGVDFSSQYFTVEYLEDGYYTPYRVGSRFYLSFDNGSTWKLSTEYGDSERVYLNKGDKILFKREYTGLETVNHLGIESPYDPWESDIVTNGMMDNIQLESGISNWIDETNEYYTVKYKMYGNVGSLSYGDNFRNIDYSDKYFRSAEQIRWCVSAYNVYIPKYWFVDCERMFYANWLNGDGSRLVKAPKTIESMRGTNLGYMFYECRNLTTPTQLPDTILYYEGCYESMFYNCTSLVNAPELPATTLSVACYRNMFDNCTSLVNAPVLPAMVGARQSYYAMFNDCTSLRKIICFLRFHNTEIVGNGWTTGVPTDGLFIYNSENTDWNIYNNGYGVPYQWTIQTVDNSTHYSDWRVIDGYICDGSTKYAREREYVSYDNINWYAYDNIREGQVIEYHSSDCMNPSMEYLTIISHSDNNEIRFKMTNSDPIPKTISVSTNYGIDWYDYTSTVNGVVIANLDNGDRILVKGENVKYGKSSDMTFFATTGDFEVSGNIMSLIYGDNFVGQTAFNGGTYNFYGLFNNCTGLISAENLVLPATTLTEGCYQSMFNGCTSLTTAPELPATTLAEICYYEMFRGCTGLTTAHELPATTLADSCYGNMFMNCTNLTTAPELPATTLVYRCYSSMFSGCSNLNYIKMLATDISAGQCLFSWVWGVSATGTFVKSSSMTSLPTGASGIPSGWTVQDA